MPRGGEVRRLAGVYRAYRESDATQARWDHRNPGNRAIAEERRLAIGRSLVDCGFGSLEALKVLDVGCGPGHVLASMEELGARPEDLYGVDVLPDRIAEAQRRHPEIDFQCANAESMPFPDGSFDLVLLFTLFSSVLNGMAQQPDEMG